jgi:DNA invertase Pin-like site-specific DNA recombinase
LQRDALLGAGVDPDHLYADHASGRRDDRPGLAACLKALRAGDTLVVWKLDRLGRNLHHLINTVHDLTARGVGLKVLTGQGAAIDTTTPAGKLVFAIFAALAEFERDAARGITSASSSGSRSRAGREVAKAAGRVGGRPVKLTSEKRAAALTMRERGDMTMAQIARALGVGRTTLYEHLGDLPPLDGIERGRIDELAA